MKPGGKRPPAAPAAPAYSDTETWLDLWLHNGQSRVPYRKNLLDAMGMAIYMPGEPQEELIRAISEAAAARLAAHAAADVYMTKRAVLDGAMRRLSGKEDEERER